MTKYLKKEEAFSNGKFSFNLTTKEGIEKFTLWDNVEKKYVRENTSLQLENGEQQVTKYIKLSDNDKKRYTRKVSVVREIIHNDEKKLYDFPLSVETDIQKALKFFIEENIDFSTRTFIITKEGTGIATRYSVETVKNKQSSLPKPEVSFDDELSLDDETDLTPEEQAILEKIPEKYPEYRTRPPKVFAEAIVKKLNISYERALTIVEKNLYN